jgi:predicted transcriptional regulator
MDDDITFEMERLKKEYSSFESLQQKVSTLKCRNPDLIDDYVVWNALRKKGCSITEKIILQTFDIFSMVSQRRMELLSHLVSHPMPNSIRVLSTELRRDYKNVYDDIKALERYGLLCLVRDGKSKKIITRVKAINIRMQ